MPILPASFFASRERPLPQPELTMRPFVRTGQSLLLQQTLLRETGPGIIMAWAAAMFAVHLRDLKPRFNSKVAAHARHYQLFITLLRRQARDGLGPAFFESEFSAMSGSGKNFERGASPAEKRTLLVAEGKSGERAGGYRQTLKSERKTTMTCDQLRIGTSHGIICSVPEFKRGDPPPNDESYLAWEEWANVQYKAGLRQSQCGHCGKW